MIRWLTAGAVCVFLVLAGCDRRQPTVRRTSPSPDGGSDASEGAVSPGAPAVDHGPPSEGERQTGELGRDVDLGGVRLRSPEGWIRKQPRSGFTLAEFSLPRTEGDSADARLTVTLAGGSVEANVERWRQQFGEKPERESKQELKIDGVPVTVLDLAGTYSGQAMGMASPPEKTGIRMLGAIFPVGGQLGFVKCTGPERTVTAHADEFHAFLQSLTTGDAGRGDSSGPRQVRQTVKE
jgi:hypothetical protein